MKNSVVKLKDVLGRDVSAAEAEGVVDYLLACLTHVTNARPLFGILNTRTDELEWTAGGADFNDIFQVNNTSEPTSEARLKPRPDIVSMDQLFSNLGISDTDLAYVKKNMKRLGGETASYLEEPMMGKLGRCFRVVMRRPKAPNENHIQFSILDITHFKKAAESTRKMAKTLSADLSAPLEGGGGTQNILLGIVDDLDVLFRLDTDFEIKTHAQKMSDKVTQVSEQMVSFLRNFEEKFETRHWQPNDLDPCLGPAISVHTTPMTHWGEQRSKVMTELDGEPAVHGVDVFGLQQAYDFVQQAEVIFAISPSPGCIYVLNGPLGGQRFGSIDEFVRGIDVEENSIHTALDFFEGLGDAPALGVFAIANQNQEVWGRPGLYHGWQAMLVTSKARAVDVRGLFHGLKNLMLHLQVLYVVKNRSDVDQVKKDLTASGQKIRQRLADIGNIALTGQRKHNVKEETVVQWLKAVRLLGRNVDCEINVESQDIDDVSFWVPPGEMEDTLEELVRNGTLYGATCVTVKAFKHAGYMCIKIQDNGQGMPPKKLEQVRRVLKSGVYDKTLSTRQEGSGNGLLTAAKAVSNFVDGAFDIDHGAQGHGIEISISMKLPCPN